MIDERLEGQRLVVHPLADAAVTVINERGYEMASVEEIIELAGISRAEFDREFTGKADLVLRVMEAFLGDFRARVAAAYRSYATWPDNLRAAAYEAARWLTERPRTTRFGIVSSLEAGDMVRARREEVFIWCAGLIEDGRAVAPDPESVPPVAAIMAIGAVTETLRRRLEGAAEVDAVAIVPEMMYVAVRPYLGDEAARRELAIPPPPDLDRAGGGSAGSDT